MAEDSAPAQRLRDVRDKLCGLLEESVLYDAQVVLQRCAKTELWDEQVVLHSKVRPWRACYAAMLLVQAISCMLDSAAELSFSIIH